MSGKVTAIVLAAGESRRMGRQKLLLEFEGSTLIGRVVGPVARSCVSEVVVVTGEHHNEVMKAVGEQASGSQSRQLEAVGTQGGRPPYLPPRATLTAPPGATWPRSPNPCAHHAAARVVSALDGSHVIASAAIIKKPIARAMSNPAPVLEPSVTAAPT